jgi:hypothetical protein
LLLWCVWLLRCCRVLWWVLVGTAFSTPAAAADVLRPLLVLLLQLLRC